MKKLLLAMLAFVAFGAGVARAETLTTATGYKLEYAVLGKDAPGPIAVIAIHGKNAPPEGVLGRGMVRETQPIADAGFRVYVPVMPWSKRWDGTHEDATSAIDALVALAAKDGKKVIVGGHSMGAMFTVIYRPTSLPPEVIGKIVDAPGGMLDMIPPQSSFWKTISPALERAKSLEAAGKGKEKVEFGGKNVKGSSHTTESYTMAPEVYLSFHSPDRLPASIPALKATGVPVLWTVGSDDPLIKGSASQRSFGMMPANPKSAYHALAGENHSTSWGASMKVLIPWVKSLAGQ